MALLNMALLNMVLLDIASIDMYFCLDHNMNCISDSIRLDIR